MRAALLAAIASLALVASAAADPLPTGRVSATTGVKTGTGALASSIGFGFAAGFEAGYAPMTRNQRVGWGATWSTTWSYYFGGSARIADMMRMVEMDAGVRVRVALGARKRQVMFLGGGGTLIRTNEPIFDGDDRTQVGPWGGAGVEGRDPLFGKVLVSVAVRYALIRDGQGTLGLMLTLGGGV